jgi:hypothetical protein
MNKSSSGIGVGVFVIFLSSGCSSGPSGDYGGNDCGLYDKLSFRDNGKVYISVKMFGQQLGETAGDYTVDDNKVIVTANNQTTVFTLNDDGDLESSMLGEKITCRKGGGSSSTGNADKGQPAYLTATYGGMACILDKMTFSKDGKVDMFIDNERQAGTYSMKGNQVTVNGEGGSVVFTLNGDNLETTADGQHAVCSRM